MFTGIITGIGKIKAAQVLSGKERVLDLETPFTGLELGESVAINGVCLTVAEKLGASLTRFYVSPETCEKTNLTDLETGRSVNLERALRLGDRLSGHLVQGHVDGVGTVRETSTAAESTKISIELPAGLERFVIDKGSIALDGVSLTVNSIQNSTVWLMIIPHTLAHTTLQDWLPGRRINVEVDMVGKYVLKGAAK